MGGGRGGDWADKHALVFITTALFAMFSHNYVNFQRHQ